LMVPSSWRDTATHRDHASGQVSNRSRYLGNSGYRPDRGADGMVWLISVTRQWGRRVGGPAPAAFDSPDQDSDTSSDQAS
jgi:hypothetical protein